MSATFLGLPDLLWAGGCIVVAVVFALIWPFKPGLDGMTAIALRWLHPFVWLLLALSFLVRIRGGAYLAVALGIAGMFGAFLFAHSEQKCRLCPVFVNETFRDPLILRLLGDLDYLFVAEQKRERRAIPFCQERGQRNHGSNIFLIFQGPVQCPHLLVSLVRV